MRIAIVSVLVVFMSCVGSKNTLTSLEINQFKEKIENKNIEATFNWAQPMGLNNNVTGLQNLLPPGSSTNNINLSGNTNFLRIRKDSIHVDLPFYGQQQISRGYNSEGGVKFKGKPAAVYKNYDTKKGAYILKYELKAKDESYNVILTLYPNKKSNLNVNSSHRSSIYYTGNWKELEATSNK